MDLFSKMQRSGLAPLNFSRVYEIPNIHLRSIQTICFALDNIIYVKINLCAHYCLGVWDKCLSHGRRWIGHWVAWHQGLPILIIDNALEKHFPKKNLINQIVRNHPIQSLRPPCQKARWCSCHFRKCRSIIWSIGMEFDWKRIR